MAFICLLTLAVLGVPFGAMILDFRRREEPEKQKTELIDRKKKGQHSEKT